MPTILSRQLQRRLGKAPRPATGTAPPRDRRAEADYREGLHWSRERKWALAAQAFERAVRRCPADAVFWINLANARSKLGEADIAAEAARHAVALRPDSPQIIGAAAHCYGAANRHQEVLALIAGARADDVSPLQPYSLGVSLLALDRPQQAIAALQRAVMRQPDYGPAHVQLAHAFDSLGMHREGRACLRRALASGIDPMETRAHMAYEALQAGDWAAYDEDVAALRPLLEAGPARAQPFQLLVLPTTRVQQRAAGGAHWHWRHDVPSRMPAPRAREPGARIRLAYLSNDLHEHATAYLLAEILERHDRGRFDVRAYSYGPDDGSPMRRRLRDALGGGLVEAGQLSDAGLAQRIRDDDIDILVDLKVHTRGTRLAVPARRPARIQVNYLGYPGTSGLDFYDYVIGDRVVTPLEHAPDFSEKIAQLPHCYQPNDRLRRIGAAPRRGDCGLPDSGFVFCCFNSAFKINAAVFDRWCALLRAVPGSVLWLYESNVQARASLCEEAVRREVGAARLVWAPHAPLEQHLGRLQLADLVLDTAPYSAHTTASDALWAGVPVLTAPGETFASRVAASILTAAGLPELIAADTCAYERTALALAREPGRLAALKGRWLAQRDRCALFDSERYTRDIEDLFGRMIARQDAGLAPEHLPA